MFAHCDFVQADIVRHQYNDVVEVGFHIIHVTNHVQEFEYVHVLCLNAVTVRSSALAALNYTPYGAVKESVHCIIEKIKWCQSVLVPVLNLLCSLLESGEHGTLAAGKMLSGIAVLADLRKDLLHKNKLIRNEREILGKLACSGIALNI